MTQGKRTIGLVPHLRRSDLFGIDFPALPGWADVWRSALRALSFLPQLAAGKSAARDDKGESEFSLWDRLHEQKETADLSTALRSGRDDKFN
jgi:hypothetical protein